MLNSPLEQFKVVVLWPLSIAGLDLSITNSVLALWLCLFFIYVVFKSSIQGGYIIPSGLQRLGEVLYIFINDLVKQQSGIKGLIYFPVIFMLFYTILFLNLIGLTPLAFTCTSQICYTFTLGFGMFVGIVIIGLVVQKVNFYKNFVPKNMTGAMLVLLIIIEIFSYCIRPFSLSIRLFANMLAGHTLLHILSGFGMSLLKVDVLLGILMMLPIIAICVLEFGIAFLQAYVFGVLVCIYMKESFYGH